MSPANHITDEEFEGLISEAEKLCDRRNPEALVFIQKATEAAKLSEDETQLALVNYIVAYYDCFIQNNYDQAIKHLNETLGELDDERFLLIGHKLLMTLGNSYQLKGDLFSSQASYLKGLRGLEAKPKLKRDEETLLASFNYNLSVLLSSSELNMESEEYLVKAISLCSRLDKKFQLSKCYAAYAQLYERREDFNKAIEYLYMALAIDEEINEPYSLALTKANLGVLSVKNNDYDKSFSYLNEALNFYEESNMLWETAVVKLELGKAYVHTNNLDKGLEYINEAEKLITSLDNKKELSEIFSFKSKLLAKKGEHALAYQYLEKHVESLRFFFDTEKTNALTRAKNEFESELKEKETKLLRAKNAEIHDYVNKLEISNNELKQFAHVASHDLREPLRMITSYISLLKKSMNGKLNEQEHEFFSYVLDGAKRMDQLIHDLLRLAKVDANAILAPIKLNSVIEEIKLNVDTLIKEKNAAIVLGGLPVILADRAQMIQLFQNLIANGIKYNKSDAPEIKITFISRKDQVEIQVSDNGIGIPKHQREEAFQIFKRLHKQDNISGSGIGLAICKKIVESMKGRIKIEDKPEGGTTFKITFSKSIVVSAT